MKTIIRVHTLGKFLIERNGEVVENLITTKAMLLFTYLAMYPGEHTRKKLAFMFWSETTDKQALKNLRTVLSSLRQTLDDGLLISNEGLAINPEQVTIEVDASMFENECNRLLATPSRITLDALKAMQDLAIVYQGDFLKNITVRDAVDLDNWIVEKQRHLHQLYIRLLYEMVEVAEKQGNYEVGLTYAWKLVHLDSLWDGAQRQLMRLLTYTSRANEALRHYEAFVRLLEIELQSEPEEETTLLYEQIRAKTLRPPQSVRRATIVLPEMPFVEPTDDVALVQRMLNTPQCHLLTIYGISGSGKTSLATRIAFHRQQLYPDGAYFISLKSNQSAYDLPFAIAGVLGVDVGNTMEQAQSLLEDAILDHLRQRKLLLVLDNYEHILPETGLIERILEDAHQVQMIITSQAPLNLFREWLLPLNGLRVPPDNEPAPENYEAVRLFEVTAQRVNPRFNLQEHMAGVVKICQLVDGLPLALVIAAGWTHILPVQKIIDYIVAGQEFTLPFQQNLPPRHQSLELMLEYTWNTLTPPEKQALTALSIFNASFDLEEAEQIGAVDLHILSLLIQKSLIQKFGDRYRIHQLILRYAHRKLLYSDQKTVLGERYLAYFTHVLNMFQQQKLPLHEYLIAVEQLDPGLRHYTWMDKSFQPVYLLVISRYLIAYWEILRPDLIPAMQDIFSKIEQVTLPEEIRILLHLQLGRLSIFTAQHDLAEQHLQCILLANPAQSAWVDQAHFFNLYSSLMALKKQPPSTAPTLEDEAAIFHRTQLTLIRLYLDMGDYQTADAILASLFDQTTDRFSHGLILGMRGAIAAEMQQYARASEHFANALAAMAPVNTLALKPYLATLLSRTMAQPL